jgi:hypothetical protein
MRKDQNGLGAIEALLIAVIIGIVGFAGWFVYNSQKKTNQSLDNTNRTQANINKQAQAETKPPEQAKYLEVKEWGIKIPVKEVPTLELREIVHGSYAAFSTPQLNGFKKDCSGKNAVAVYRGKASENVPTETGSNGSTYEEVSRDSTKLFSRVGDYYYVKLNYGHASCANNQDEEKTEADITNKIERALHAMQQN